MPGSRSKASPVGAQRKEPLKESEGWQLTGPEHRKLLSLFHSGVHMGDGFVWLPWTRASQAMEVPPTTGLCRDWREHQVCGMIEKGAVQKKTCFLGLLPKNPLSYSPLLTSWVLIMNRHTVTVVVGTWDELARGGRLCPQDSLLWWVEVRTGKCLTWLFLSSRNNRKSQFKFTPGQGKSNLFQLWGPLTCS